MSVNRQSFVFFASSSGNDVIRTDAMSYRSVRVRDTAFTSINKNFYTTNISWEQRKQVLHWTLSTHTDLLNNKKETTTVILAFFSDIGEEKKKLYIKCIGNTEASHDEIFEVRKHRYVLLLRT